MYIILTKVKKNISIHFNVVIIMVFCNFRQPKRLSYNEFLLFTIIF
jgi:hypothetical protein